MYTYRRKQMDLCGTWGFFPDPYERGISQKWWLNERKKDKGFPCYDDDTTLVEVPHNWNAHQQELKFYEGNCLYLKKFDLPNVQQIIRNQEIWIDFEGANYHSKVYLNGEFVGEHFGGYTGFQFNITPYIKETNRLWVVVNNTRSEDTIPAKVFDWWNDGGIYRPVKLVFTPKQYIEDFSVFTKIREESVCLSFKVMLNGSKQLEKIPFTVEVKELGIQLYGETFIDGTGHVDYYLDKSELSLWCPQNPKLYQVTIRTTYDEIQDDVGFREISTREGDILLNGQSIFLKGINFHDEYQKDGRTPRKELIDKAFSMFKELGLNYLRLPHYQHTEEIIRRADEEGILLWEEIPLFWYPHWECPSYYKSVEAVLLEMIGRDKNRASVILWSVGNEMEKNSLHAKYLITLAKLAKHIDPTRLTTYACSWAILDFEKKIATPGMPAELYETLDVVAFNKYMGYGEGQPEDLDWIINSYAQYGKPVVMSEFGASSKRGYENGIDDIHSEEKQVDVVSRQLKTALQNPNIKGLSPWHFCDFRTPLRHMNQEKFFNRKGFVDEEWQPKKVYDILKNYYRECRK